MAEPYLQNGVWRLRYKDRLGRWQQPSCKAKTKAEAKRLNREAERREERFRLGIDEPPLENTDATFAGMVTWWVDTSLVNSPAYRRCVGTVKNHLLKSSLAHLPVSEVTSPRINNLLLAKEQEVGGATINHIRMYARRIFSAAIRAGRFHGANPVDTRKVPKRRVPKRKPRFLTPDQVSPVLAALTDRWRNLFATAVYAGLRKGELFALEKPDVDISERTLTVRRSHASDTTKGKHDDVIPIAGELVPYLKDAIGRSPCQLVFPRRKGAVWTRWAEGKNLTSMLRTALRRAGFISGGYLFKCRRKNCGYREESQNGTPRRCPRCNMKLYRHGIVEPLRFHDLRHTTAAILLRRGASPAAVQRIMRHEDIRTTIQTYGHIGEDLDYLRREVDRLSFGSPVVDGSTPPREGSDE